MKRFLQYAAYREGYRFLRDATEDITEKNQKKDSRSLSDPLPESNSAINHSKNTGDILSMELLQKIDPYDFEHFVADLWELMGWETEVSSSSLDKGVDITAKKSEPYEQTVLIQAKRYGPNSTVGSPAVQQYNSLKHQQEGVDKVIIVTTNGFSKQAKNLAENLNVKLVNGEKLVSLLEQFGGERLLRKYIDESVLPPEPSRKNATKKAHSRPEKATTSTTATGPDDIDSASTDGNWKQKSRSDPNEKRKSRSEKAVPNNHITSWLQSDPDIWRKGVGLGVIGWIIITFGSGTLPTAFVGLLLLSTWILLPAAIYKDYKTIPSGVDWPIHPWAYILSSTIWIFAIIPGVLYLYRRDKYVPDAAREKEQSAKRPGKAENSDKSTKTPKLSLNEDSDSESSLPVASDDRDSVPEISSDAGKREISHEGETYRCEIVTSPNGRWTAAYSREEDGSSRYFVFEEDELVITGTSLTIQKCHITDKGITAFVSGDDRREFFTHNPSGKDLHHLFNSDIVLWDGADDGRIIAVVTSAPDVRTYVFNADKGGLKMVHQNRYNNIKDIHLSENEEEWRLYIESATGGPDYAINLNGDVIWEEYSPEEENSVKMQESSVNTSSEETPEEVVQTYFQEVLGNGDLSRIDQLLADNYVGHETGIKDMGFEDIGKSETIEGLKENEQAFPNANYIIEDMVSKGDTVAIRWRFEGTHEGELAGMPATNRDVSYIGMNFIRVEDGKIVEDWEVSDVVAMYSQLGLNQ